MFSLFIFDPFSSYLCLCKNCCLKIEESRDFFEDDTPVDLHSEYVTQKSL